MQTKNTMTNKKEFLEKLEKNLYGLSKEDASEILDDYREHFKVGQKKKRKESEIAESLGDPVKIARDAKGELLKSSGRGELKTEMFGAWIETKKFVKHIYRESKDRLQTFIKEEKRRYERKEFTKEIWVILVLFTLGSIFNCKFFTFAAIGVIIYSAIKSLKEDKKPSKNLNTKKNSKKIKDEKTSSLKFVLSLIFNGLFFVWFWVSLLSTLVAVLFSALAVFISGVAIMAFSAFALISHYGPLTKDILFSALFAGAGVTILGWIMGSLIGKLTKLFFKATKKYVELNMRFIRK